MPRVCHFEIHADDPQRAIAFYKGLFDWEFKTYGGPIEYWVITTGPDGAPGINGGLLRRPCPLDAGQAMKSYVCTIDVANLDASLKKALATGGELAMPKSPIPGIGWLAYCKDPEGNVFGMLQPDPTARP